MSWADYIEARSFVDYLRLLDLVLWESQCSWYSIMTMCMKSKGFCFEKKQDDPCTVRKFTFVVFEVKKNPT